jgi:hypothetical protein
MIPRDSPSCYDSAPRNLVVLFIHLIATLARLLGPGGVRSIVAEFPRLRRSHPTTNCAIGDSILGQKAHLFRRRGSQPETRKKRKRRFKDPLLSFAATVIDLRATIFDGGQVPPDEGGGETSFAAGTTLGHQIQHSIQLLDRIPQ